MAAKDPYGGGSGRWDAPAYNAYAITTSDNTDVPTVTRAIYVGVAGDLTVIMPDRVTTLTFKNCIAGSFIPIAVSRIMATGTTASSLIGIF